MGREIRCTVRSSGEQSEGKALLETNEVIFRGDFRLKIPFASLQSVAARGGKLHLKWSGEQAIFELGEDAEKWAHKILHPKSTAEKLGFKPGLRISTQHMPDDGFVQDARKAAAVFADGTLLRDSDLIFLGAEVVSDLAGVKKAIPSLAANGSLWIVYPKGRKEITELQVLNAGRDAGLVDLKVVGYSATRTALKFVRPKTER